MNVAYEVSRVDSIYKNLELGQKEYRIKKKKKKEF